MNFVRVVVLVLTVTNSCFGQSARDIARTAFKSVVLLEMNDSNGQPLSLGSGFFVSNGIIATNAHVIEGASSGTAKLVGGAHTTPILGAVAVDHHADLALLKVDSPAPNLVLGPNSSPTVGDSVYVVGNPLGLEGTFSTGIISGVRHAGADSILQMTAPISPGSSGGPVMDSSGAVIGVSVATFKDGQNLNLAVPVSYLNGLMASSSNKAIPLGNTMKVNQSSTSMLEGVGTKSESGVTVSDYHLTICNQPYGYTDQEGKYTFRMTNRLPVEISDVHLRVLDYDWSGSLMDFEDATFGRIPAGLTKTIVEEPTEESKRAGGYYCSGERGTPKIEIRVLRFNAKEPE